MCDSMNSRLCGAGRALALVPIIVGLAACSSVKEESGTKTEYNTETGRFETAPYASVSFPYGSGSNATKTLSEKELNKTREK